MIWCFLLFQYTFNTPEAGMELVDITMIMTHTEADHNLGWKSNSERTILHIKFCNNPQHRIEAAVVQDFPWKIMFKLSFEHSIGFPYRIGGTAFYWKTLAYVRYECMILECQFYNQVGIPSREHRKSSDMK